VSSSHEISAESVALAVAGAVDAFSRATTLDELKKEKRKNKPRLNKFNVVNIPFANFINQTLIIGVIYNIRRNQNMNQFISFILGYSCI
jgi:hypothetical protein